MALPEEAVELGLRPGDGVEIRVLTIPRHAALAGVSQLRTLQERAKAYRLWAEGHSAKTPLLSDNAISRESIYGERG